MNSKHFALGAMALGVVVAGIAGSQPAHAQAADCSAAVGDIVKTLKISPKAVALQNVMLACIRSNNKPALAARNMLNRFVAEAKITADGIAIDNCQDAVLYSMATAGAPTDFSSPQNLTAACKNAKDRPALATRNFSHRFITANKITDGKPAKPEMAKTCIPKLTQVAKMLRINPKFANDKDIKTACGIAKGKPALATRNFTTRFVKTAGIK